MIYFRKLVDLFPSFARETAPRFYSLVQADISAGIQRRDRAMLDRALADMFEILPFMRGRPRRRMKRAAPLIRLAARFDFWRTAGKLLNWASKRRRNKRRD